MIKDKKTKAEIPANSFELKWIRLKDKLKSENEELKESIKPENRKKQLEETKEFIRLNEELIKTCDKNLK